MNHGKLSQAALERSVLRELSRAKVLGQDARPGADSAVWQTEDSQKETMQRVSIAGGALGGRFDMSLEMILQGAVNDLASDGAVAGSLLIDLTLPPEAPESVLKEIMHRIAAFAAEKNMVVEGGDSRVSSAVTRPVLGVTALGNGRSRKKSFKIEGATLIMAGFAGAGGTAMIADIYREELLKRFPVSLVQGALDLAQPDITMAAEIAWRKGAVAMHDISRGGVYGALWELGEKLNCGFEVDLRSIPIRQETIELCEYKDLHPYRLFGQGALLILCQDPAALLRAFEESSIQGQVIGHCHTDRARVLHLGEEVHYLEKPQTDPLDLLSVRLVNNGAAKAHCLNNGGNHGKSDERTDTDIS